MTTLDVTSDVDLGRPVKAIWTDSGMHHDAGWSSKAEFFEDGLKALNVETVGLWLGESETAVAIAQSRDDHNDNWMAVQVIWKLALISKEWLDGK